MSGNLTPQEAAILALLDRVQALETMVAKLQTEFAKSRDDAFSTEMKNHFTGLKVVNERRGSAA